MIVKAFKGKEFESKEEFISFFKSNKQQAVALKCAAIKEGAVSLNYSNKFSEVQKDVVSDVLKYGDDVTNVISSMNYYDSHGDVHLEGNWNKSAKEQNGRIHHAMNHDLSVGNIVAYPKDVKLSVSRVAWKELGVDIDGSTEVLLGKSLMTDKSNSDAFKGYRDNVGFKHSPRMRYIDGAFAIKSDDPELAKENALYEKVYPMVANKEDIKDGIFFAVKQAALVGEFSTVINPSNEATPRIKTEPSQDTQEKDTHAEPSIDYQYLIKNFNTKN
jgi:hypothetical protein